MIFTVASLSSVAASLSAKVVNVQPRHRSLPKTHERKIYTSQGYTEEYRVGVTQKTNRIVLRIVVRREGWTHCGIIAPCTHGVLAVTVCEVYAESVRQQGGTLKSRFRLLYRYEVRRTRAFVQYVHSRTEKEGDSIRVQIQHIPKLGTFPHNSQVRR